LTGAGTAPLLEFSSHVVVIADEEGGLRADQIGARAEARHALLDAGGPFRHSAMA
jgi:hypothetical protein